RALAEQDAAHEQASVFGGVDEMGFERKRFAVDMVFARRMEVDLLQLEKGSALGRIGEAGRDLHLDGVPVVPDFETDAAVGLYGFRIRAGSARFGRRQVDRRLGLALAAASIFRALDGAPAGRTGGSA